MILVSTTPVFLATGTSEVQLVTGYGHLEGVNIVETAGASAVLVNLRDGLDVTGPIIWTGSAAAGGAPGTDSVPGAEFKTGIFVERAGAGGSAQVIAYIRRE